MSPAKPRHRLGVHPRPARPRRWPRRVLITANVVVGLTIAGCIGAYGYVQYRLGQIHKQKLDALASPPANHPAKAFTMLVVGSDSRSALTGPDNSQFGGTAAVGGQRSDTMILLRVAPSSHQLMMMSVPRDLWVNIPGRGPNRINSAFDFGPNLLIQTIEQDLGIPINHYAEVNFDTFRDVTNAVGGVKLYFPTPAKDTYSDMNIAAAGCYSLTGDQALAFVRARHYQYQVQGRWVSESQSDLARIQRQQMFIKKMIKKAEGEFTNPLALNGVIGGVTKNLTVDTGFSSDLMIKLAENLRSVDAGAIPSTTLPNYPYTTAGGAQVLGLEQPQAAQTIAAFNRFGETSPAADKPAAAKPAAAKPGARTPAVAPVTVAPAKVSVEIANGTGTAGEAGEMSQTLAALGYQVSVTTSSAGSSMATTEIRYAPDALAPAKQLAAQIPGSAVLTEDAGLTPTPFNVEVVAGSSYTGGSAASASTPTTTTGSAPGSNSAVYQMPGATGPPPPGC
jgi:polyisoprenyl-teichoic acid--peptidoglycan teichoic acid transferase